MEVVALDNTGTVDASEIKRMDIKEFREKGYLQEINRIFLHPLGLAMEVIVDNEGNEKLGGIWDYRHDEEGIHYGINDSKPERIALFKERAEFIDSEIRKKINIREAKLGFIIEPIDGKI